MEVVNEGIVLYAVKISCRKHEIKNQNPAPFNLIEQPPMCRKREILTA
jgi:hypothetical protein